MSGLLVNDEFIAGGNLVWQLKYITINHAVVRVIDIGVRHANDLII